MERDSRTAPGVAGLSRRRFLGLTAGGTGLLLGCGSAASPARLPAATPAGARAAGQVAATAVPTARPLDRVRFVYVAQSAIFGPAWVAQEAGYYAKYGLEVELSNIPGATRLQQAVLAGEVDYQLVAGPMSIAATVAGAPTVVIWVRR